MVSQYPRLHYYYKGHKCAQSALMQKSRKVVEFFSLLYNCVMLVAQVVRYAERIDDIAGRHWVE